MNGEPGASYVVRRWSGLWRLAGSVVPVLAVGVALGLVQHRLLLNVVTVAVALAIGLRGFDGATAALRVDADGITWNDASVRLAPGAGRRTVPWSSMHDVGVVEGEAVTLRLRNDAPKPAWMTARVLDPGAPDDRTVVEGSAPGVEGARLQAVAQSRAPEVCVRLRLGRTASGGTEPGR